MQVYVKCTKAAAPSPPVVINYSKQLEMLINIGNQVLAEAIEHNQVVPPDYSEILAAIQKVLGSMTSLKETITLVGAENIAGIKELIASLHSDFMAQISAIETLQSSMVNAFAAFGSNLEQTIIDQSNQVEELLIKISEQNQPINLEIHSMSYLAGVGGLTIEIQAGRQAVSLVPYQCNAFVIDGTIYNGGSQWHDKVDRGCRLPRREIEISEGTSFTLTCHSDTRLKLPMPLVVGTALEFVPDNEIDGLSIDRELEVLVDQLDSTVNQNQT